MAVSMQPKLALVYHEDAYVESGGHAIGLMGRQVAGRAFLDAYLSHGTFTELTAVLRQRGPAASLVELWRGHPATPSRRRTLRIIDSGDFHQAFFPSPPATVLHSPQPPDPAFAWARQQGGPHAFALSGVTHTLCSPEAMDLLRSLVTAPFEAYDTLVCTSHAVATMVREVTEAYADHLRARLGGVEGIGPAASLPPRLETIPLGVDIERFHPANIVERITARRLLNVADEELVILYVGRLSHHAKAHPFPMFKGASEAAAASGGRVHLILAGWAAHPAVHDAFVEAARHFAATVKTSLVDGRDPRLRQQVWHAADIFVSPSDNIQETFGLAVVEAMASGLPVVASDWDGYRDLVVDGETGFLVPTAMVAGATRGATTRLLTGELTYDHFLAEISQATVVDAHAMGAALSRLAGDRALRRQMGEAGRRRACERFAWSYVIRLYEDLWREQDRERSARAGTEPAPPRTAIGPAAYPDIERSFAGYPTQWLDGASLIIEVPGALDGLEALLALPLAHHAAGRRVTDAGLLRAAFARLPCPVEDLDRFWSTSGVDRGVGRATLAWMLKYDMVRCSHHL